MDPASGPVPVRVLLVSGSTRARSTNTAALRTLLGLAGPGVDVDLWAGLVDMPAFVPEDDNPEPQPVAALRAELAAADAVVFCTPEYAGGRAWPAGRRPGARLVRAVEAEHHQVVAGRGRAGAARVVLGELQVVTGAGQAQQQPGGVHRRCARTPL